jgi:hypothetical protein
MSDKHYNKKLFEDKQITILNISIIDNYKITVYDDDYEIIDNNNIYFYEKKNIFTKKIFSFFKIK